MTEDRQAPSASGPWAQPAPAAESGTRGGGPWATISSSHATLPKLERLGVRGPGPGGYVHANLAARLGAKLLDVAVLALAIAPGLVLALMWSRTIGALVAGAAALLVVLRQGSLLAASGQTLGKRWLGLRVIGEQGERVDWLRGVIVRAWATTVGGALLIGIPLILDALAVFGQRRQCLHDRLAKTLVIEARTPGDPYA